MRLAVHADRRLIVYGRRFAEMVEAVQPARERDILGELDVCSGAVEVSDRDRNLAGVQESVQVVVGELRQCWRTEKTDRQSYDRTELN
ncbi:hypothetical protein [Ruegeria profundi]|uniref:Uncharacterized protein n=1 Tax=Ruegeria profundi TaxID=1685378 RepID=A0A0X3TNJ1_9RHOB|nr:hypothetical protein [Ruegeria profundi]KUJ77284.1 hypothetical protein AVO44_18055 [Ruegeria profundi]